jgi:hypothetical protein
MPELYGDAGGSILSKPDLLNSAIASAAASYSDDAASVSKP